MRQELVDYMVWGQLKKIEYSSKIEPSDEINLLKNNIGDIDIEKIEGNIIVAKKFVEERKKQKLGKVQYVLYSVDGLNKRFGRPTSFFRAGLGRYDDHKDILHLSNRCINVPALVHEIVHKYHKEAGITELQNNPSRYDKKMDSVFFGLSEGDATRLQNIVSCAETKSETKSLENKSLKRLVKSFLRPIAKPLVKLLVDEGTNQLDYRKFIYLAEMLFRFTPLRFNVGYSYIKGAEYLCRLEDFGGEDLIDFALFFPQRSLTEPSEMYDYYRAVSEKLERIVNEIR